MEREVLLKVEQIKSIKLTKEILLIGLDDLKLNQKNEKTHPQEQLEKISKSILSFGFTTPLLVDENFEIIAGYGRYKVAKEILKMTAVPRIVVQGLTNSQKKALRLSDNRVAESDWNEDLLKETFNELNADGFDLSLTGFDFNEITFESSDIETDIKIGVGSHERSKPVKMNEWTYGIIINFTNADDRNDFHKKINDLLVDLKGEFVIKTLDHAKEK